MSTASDIELRLSDTGCGSCDRRSAPGDWRSPAFGLGFRPCDLRFGPSRLPSMAAHPRCRPTDARSTQSEAQCGPFDSESRAVRLGVPTARAAVPAVRGAVDTAPVAGWLAP